MAIMQASGASPNMAALTLAAARCEIPRMACRWTVEIHGISDGDDVETDPVAIGLSVESENGTTGRAIIPRTPRAPLPCCFSTTYKMTSRSCSISIRAISGKRYMAGCGGRAA
jgi:hypothetical protein